MKRWTGLLVLLVIGALVGQEAFAADRIQDGPRVLLNYYFEADGVPLVAKEKSADMRLVVGSGPRPPVFEKSLIGLKAGDRKVITLKPEDAFGPSRPELIRRIPKDQWPKNMPLEEGQTVFNKNGAPVMKVVRIMGDSVVVDQNHPFAGKTLVYHITVKTVQ